MWLLMTGFLVVAQVDGSGAISTQPTSVELQSSTKISEPKMPKIERENRDHRAVKKPEIPMPDVRFFSI